MQLPRIILSVLCALALQPAQAAVEVAGVRFEDQTRVADTELQLNGAGLRSRLVFKVYAIGLYLPQKSDNPGAVLAMKGARRIQIVTLRELSGEQLAEALVESMQKNLGKAELDALSARLETFRKTMLTISLAPEKTLIRLDFMPDRGTRLTVGGEQRGNDIAGEDFYAALLRIWLGEHAVQNDLRAALLGGKQ